LNVNGRPSSAKLPEKSTAYVPATKTPGCPPEYGGAVLVKVSLIAVTCLWPSTKHGGTSGVDTLPPPRAGAQFVSLNGIGSSAICVVCAITGIALIPTTSAAAHREPRSAARIEIFMTHPQNGGRGIRPHPLSLAKPDAHVNPY
jgi:hypothetical protein